MLKRRRPSTPPASLEALPSPTFSDLDYENYNTKRRRIVAPILDGRQRGLPITDDDWPDEDEESHLDASATTFTGNLDWTEQADRYKHTNALLHQLHLEHQHRSQTLQSGTLNHVPRNSDVVPSFPGQHGKPVSLGILSRIPYDPRPSIPTEPSKYVTAEDELKQVRAHYEEHNRLLGSLVRGRMQDHRPNADEVQ